MEKLKFKDKEVHLGDTIVLHDTQKHPIFGNVKTTVEVVITKDNITKLIDEGVLTQSRAKDISYFVNKMAENKGWKYEKMLGFLQCLEDFNPMLPVRMLLMEIAKELDKNYAGNIKNVEAPLYAIDLHQIAIVEVPYLAVKNYWAVALFRTKEDAQFALNVISDILTNIINGQ